MNLHISPEDMAKIQEHLKEEMSCKPANPIAKALESADAIRENLVAVKGEKYALLVEIGVLIHKRTKLMAFVTSVMSDVIEEFGDEQRMAIGQVDASLSAKTLNYAAIIYGGEDFKAADAQELTGWIDKIIDAEDSGVSGLANELFGKEDE